MPSVPRIFAVVPHGRVVRPEQGIRVVVAMPWVVRPPSDVEAVAVAWTATAVEVEWLYQGEPRRDWVPADTVRRPGEPPRPPADRLPRSPRRGSRW